jgi:hypothetical protein
MNTSSWKRDAEHCCPHGLKVYLVDGKYVRDVYDSDFCQGGNGFAYTFVPKDEIWIDAAITEDEWHLIEFHECGEAELMRGGMSYDVAHDKIKEQEDRLRRRARSTKNAGCPITREEALKMVALLRPAAEYLNYRDQGLEYKIRAVISRLKLVP